MSDFVTLLVFVISLSAGLGTRYWSHDEVCKCPLNTIHVFPFWNYVRLRMFGTSLIFHIFIHLKIPVDPYFITVPDSNLRKA